MDILELLRSEAYPRTEIWHTLESDLRQRVFPTLDERVPAVQIIGSHPKGYATPESDVDFKLYVHGVSDEDAVGRYGEVQEALIEEGWRPCSTGSHHADHHIVHLDKIRAAEVKLLPLIPTNLYFLLGRHDFIWIHESIIQTMNIADLFAGGFVEHSSMEGYRAQVVSDVLANPNSQRLWEVADSLYRGHVSQVSLKRHGFSSRERRDVVNYRRTTFGLPELEQIAQA